MYIAKNKYFNNIFCEQSVKSSCAQKRTCEAKSKHKNPLGGYTDSNERSFARQKTTSNPWLKKDHIKSFELPTCGKILQYC